MEKLQIFIKLPYYLNSFMIDTNCSSLLLTLKLMYGCYCSNYFISSKKTEIITVIKLNSVTHTVLYQNIYQTTDNPVQIIENIIFMNNKITPNIFALHAGSVCKNSTAYIFVASTTSGKTTLTAYLSKLGFKYVSDDCVYIDMKSYNVYPCHKPIHLRQGGYDILKNYNIQPLNAAYISEPSIKRYIYTPECLSPQILYIGRIFFIERIIHGNEVCPLSMNISIKRLMVSPISPYVVSSEYLHFIKKLSTYCSVLRYSDMQYVADKISEINE